MGNGLHGAAFDDLADSYDSAFTGTPLGRALRSLVWTRLETLFSPEQRILELGCGTGEDAVHLALRGVRVLATDASPKMIAVARKKALQYDCAPRIEFQCIAMEDVPELLEGRQLDGAFSNFGALNCTRDLHALTAALSRRLVQGAPLLAVVMGRYVPWEWLWYLCRGDAGRSVRRLRREGTIWRGMRISYPTPREFSAVLQPHFPVTRVLPLGCVLPPSYAAAWLNRSPRTLRLMTRLEGLAQRSASLAALADHYIVEARNAGATMH